MSTDWHLDNLITSMGSKYFEGALVDGMRALVGVDHCILVEYPREHTHPLTLLSAGSIKEELARDCADLYDNRLYRHDPNLKHIHQKNPKQEDRRIVMGHKLVKDYQDREYREVLINRCDISEKLSLLFQSSKANYCLSLYRLASSLPYDRETIQRLQKVDRILGSIVEKHAQMVSVANDRSELGRFELNWIRDRLESSCAQVLTARELDVCARIILGETSEAIGLNLKISLNTVLTHRKNAYEKLGIGTQNQLFAIVVEGQANQSLH